MGMVESRRPWKSMMLMGESGAGSYPRSGALHTVPALATLPASLSITRVQMNIPPLDIPGSVLELATNLQFLQCPEKAPTIASSMLKGHCETL